MIAFTSFSSLFSNVITMLSGLLVTKWMLPDELGFFNAFSIITSYIVLVQLGIPSGLSRELPYYYGKGDHDAAQNFASVAQFWAIFNAIVILIISSIVALFFFLKGKLEYAMGTLTIGVTSFQTFYTTKYLKILFKSNLDFNKLALISIVISIISFLTIYFVWKYKFLGLCLRAIFISIFDFIITFILRPIKVQPFWSKDIFKKLLKVGMPIYFVSSIFSLWPILQRTLILFFGGTKALGLYALAIIIDNTLQAINQSISSISFPKMAFAFGQNAKFIELIKIPFKFVIITFTLYLFLIACAWYLLPLLVKKLIPNYIDGLEAAQWMLVFSLLSVFSIFSNIYMVINKNFDRLKTYIFGMLAWASTIFINFYVFGNEFDLPIFPKAMIVGYLIMYAFDLLFYNKYRLELK